jgi:hypothetical protein
MAGVQSGQLSVPAAGWQQVFAAGSGGIGAVPNAQVTVILQLISGPSPQIVKSGSATAGPFLGTEPVGAQASALSASTFVFLGGWDEIYLYGAEGACVVNAASIPTTAA